MTSNVKRHVSLPKSSKEGAKPSTDDLFYGELAVNYAKGKEFLSLNNSGNEIVTLQFNDKGFGKVGSDSGDDVSATTNYDKFTIEGGNISKHYSAYSTKLDLSKVPESFKWRFITKEVDNR